MYVIVHEKYLPDIKIVTYLVLVLATQFYICYTFLFTDLTVYVPMCKHFVRIGIVLR